MPFSSPPLWVPAARAAIVLAGAIAHALAWPMNVDDAYIIYRYAKHLAEGHGWQYNVGETFNGVTCPLYTLLLAALARLHPDVPFWAHVVGALAAIATGLLVFDLFRRNGRPVAGAAAGLLAVASPLLTASVGLETPLYLALCVLAVWLAIRDARWLTGLALGLAALTRGDAVLLAGLLGGYEILARRRLPWRQALAFLAVVTPWLAFSLATFGELLPHTLGAKMGQGASGFWGRRPAMLFAGLDVLTMFMGSRWLPVVLALLALPGLRGLPWPGTVLLVYGAAVTGAYILLDVPPYHWYFAPLVLALCVAAGAGAERLVTLSTGRLWRAATGVAFGLLVLHQASLGYFFDLRHHAYRDLALRLKARIPPTASIAAVEIGHLGWYSERPIVDLLGLVTPGVADHVARPDTGGWLGVVRADYVVLHEPPWPVEAAAVASSTFHREYTLLEEREYGGYGRYRIYARRPAGRRRSGAAGARARAGGPGRPAC